MIKENLTIFLMLLLNTVVLAQYSPPAGQFGTTAVHKDSSSIVSWAKAVVQFQRGASDIANGWGSLASFGDSTQALDHAEGNSTNVVSLGDSGSITLAFPFPIMNGPGNDFAVFENSFSDDYLEFAFVEVSSDGINFVRFPSVSLIPVITQTGPYENSNTELVHNLAGKFRQGYGTPFDLNDLIDSAGLNLDSILFVRIVDVIGSIDMSYTSFDSQGNRINDPYPTDFSAGGFDLDGVGVINENNIYASYESEKYFSLSVFPNPSHGEIFIQTQTEFFDLEIYDGSGRLIWSQLDCSSGSFQLDFLQEGVYFIRVGNGDDFSLKRILII
ncbi:MAG: T9SS type A sorting domain-containing protein [Crocinitomicaceae bacterium]|nr:T9SS type A sorting domain-containing protein [Crocinitomicaceae bacterium]